MVKAYGLGKVTAYKYVIDNKEIFLDFGSRNITQSDIKNVDYIFITHEHLDHWEMLLKYELVKELNPKCEIYATKTTKELIQFLAIERIKKYSYKEEAYNYIINIINNIKSCLLKKEYELSDTLKFTLFRSGHTFGSSMIYIKSNTKKILYTGDFDYIKKNFNRQYDLPYGLEVDELIVDGTNLVKNFYKGIKLDDIRSYVLRHNEASYYVRPEKAVFYAQYFLDHIEDCIFIYTKDMNQYLQIISSNGYNPYVEDKIMYEESLDILKHRYVNKKIIRFTTNPNDYLLDTKLSLHITTNELKKFIDDKFIVYPKHILIGHFDLKEQKSLNIQGIKNTFLLKDGENHYD